MNKTNRKSELKNLAAKTDNDFGTCQYVKLCKDSGETVWIGITENELEQIKAILT